MKRVAVALGFVFVMGVAMIGATQDYKAGGDMSGNVPLPSAPDTPLFWDDLSAENGIGPIGGNANFAVAFGGGSASTGAVPFKVEVANWQLAGTISAAAVGIWANPANSAVSVFPGPGSSGIQVVPFDGPVVSNAQGAIVAGLIGSGGSWFLGVDLNGPAANRNWAGLNPGGPLTGDPTIMGQICGQLFESSCNWIFRLGVDANIPVELESFDIE